MQFHIYIFLSLLIAVIGAAIYLWRPLGDKWAVLGHAMFFAGLFVFLLQWGPQLIGKG